MILRCAHEKSDLEGSWHRPDRCFFASGACHILSHVFLQENPGSNDRPILISPMPGFRGSHVLVSNGATIFDYHGYSDHDRYVAHYFAKMDRFFPGWQGNLIPVEESSVDSAFCSRHNHRLPHQYFRGPLPRAKKYLSRFNTWRHAPIAFAPSGGRVLPSADHRGGVRVLT